MFKSIFIHVLKVKLLMGERKVSLPTSCTPLLTERFMVASWRKFVLLCTCAWLNERARVVRRFPKKKKKVKKRKKE